MLLSGEVLSNEFLRRAHEQLHIRGRKPVTQESLTSFLYRQNPKQLAFLLNNSTFDSEVLNTILEYRSEAAN